MQWNANPRSIFLLRVSDVDVAIKSHSRKNNCDCWLGQCFDLFRYLHSGCSRKSEYLISTHIYAYLLTYVGAADGDLLAGLHSDLLRDLLVPVEDDEVLRLRGGGQDARHVVTSSCKNISYSVQKYFLLCATSDLLQGVAAWRAGQELAQPHSGLAPANSHRVKGGN